MNKTLTTTLIVIAILALAYFAGSAYASINAYGWNNSQSNSGYGPGMMGGYNNNQPNSGYGQGMMGRGNGNGMMGGYGGYNGANSNVAPLTLDQAKAAAEKYIQTLNVQGLETGEVMVFDNNAYVIIEESETGLGAFELLVDPASQVAYPEYGPNMMWNLKYGMMAGRHGMMNGYQAQTPADVSAEMTVTPKQAVEYAQKYLDANNPGMTAANDPMQFYGYYTLDFEKDGKVAGMLSVHGYNGQIFLHAWHGTFIEESK
jgi:hypothetical protein